MRHILLSTWNVRLQFIFQEMNVRFPFKDVKNLPKMTVILNFGTPMEKWHYSLFWNYGKFYV